MRKNQCQKNHREEALDLDPNQTHPGHQNLEKVQLMRKQLKKN